jgi:hypothetical protein
LENLSVKIARGQHTKNMGRFWFVQHAMKDSLLNGLNKEMGEKYGCI